MSDAPDNKACVVLIVEDDEAISELFTLTLEQEGYNVVVASDGKAGLDMIRHREPVAVLMDLMLPEVDGLTILKEMQKDPRSKDIPVVVVSAYADADDTRKVIDACPNVSKVFVKPVKANDLLEHLRGMIDGK